MKKIIINLFCIGILLGLNNTSVQAVTTFSTDVSIPEHPRSVTVDSPVSLTVDFGFGFSSIEGIRITGNFVGDLLDPGETWFVPSFGGHENISSTANESFVLDMNPEELSNFGLSDGMTNFEFTVENGSFDLDSLRVMVIGTVGISTCPNPASVGSDLDIKIPSANYQSLNGSSNIWIDLEYLRTSPEGQLMWGLKDYGINQ